MNQKTLIIIISIAGVILIGIGIFLLTRGGAEQGQTTEGPITLFPSSEDRPAPLPSMGSELTDEAANGQLSQGLVQIINIPVSGAVFNKESEKIRYFDKATGHIYEITAQGQDKQQITITTIPKIFEVLWSKDATKAVLRYFEEENGTSESLKTFVMSSISTTTQTEGIFLPTKTLSAVVSPSEDKIFYLLENGEYSQGLTATFENKNQKQIFSSQFNEFLPNWPQKNVITLLTKPSYLNEGYLYKLNPTTGYLTKIVSRIKGLTALYSPLVDSVIYSQSDNGSIATKFYNGETKKTSDLGVKTLPEKCVFSKMDESKIYCAVPRMFPSANYPDDWYQGSFFFSDAIWQIDTVNGSTKVLADYGDFDAVNLFMDQNEGYLFFQDKKDSTLWSLKIEN